MTLVEQPAVKKWAVYGAGERGLTSLMAASSRRVCGAVRGLQVVCSGCSLANGDKASQSVRFRCTRCQARGETGSRARRSGTSGMEGFRHRLFSNDNSKMESG